jgi:hypothetical protein
MLVQVERPEARLIRQDEAAALGCRLSLFGLTLLSSAAAAITRALQTMVGGAHPAPESMLPFGELSAVVGFRELDSWERRHPPDGHLPGAAALEPVGSTYGGTNDPLDALGGAFNSTCSPAGAKRRRDD